MDHRLHRLPPRLARLPSRRLPEGGTLYEATTLTARLLGLSFLKRIPEGRALLIPYCRSVHTFWMRFPIDVVFLDDHGAVVRRVDQLPPRRLVSCRKAFAVLECRAGEAVMFVTD